MNKILLALSLCIFSAAPAFADADIVPITQIYTVAGDGETDLKNTFTLNETPWAYFQIPESPAGTQHLNTRSSWFLNGDFVYSPFGVGSDAVPNNTAEVWASPDSFGSLTWADIAAAGNWRVDAEYEWTDLPAENILRSGTGSYNFTVTPEPASMALFGLGALALGARKIRRKKA